MVRKLLLRKLLIVTMVATSFGLSANAAVKKGLSTSELGNAKFPPLPTALLNFEQFGLPSKEEADKIFSAMKPDPKRKTASASQAQKVGSEQLMSDELKSFRDQLLKARDAETLERILIEADKSYDSKPNDLKYVIARMAPMIPFRGFLWRSANLAKQSRLSQEGMLSMVRTFAEQSMIYEPDTQWQAYMAFVSIPTARHLIPVTDTAGKKIRDDQSFKYENDLADFLYKEVSPALAKSIGRLMVLKPVMSIGGKTTPIVFDNKIRFGANSFNQTYDAPDRFAFIGEAEMMAAVSRFYRRLSTIEQLQAYNWNGNIALRKMIGKAYGVDAVTTMSGNAFAIDGLTRRDRIAIAQRFVESSTQRDSNGQAKKLFDQRDENSRSHMIKAYENLAHSVTALTNAWNQIKTEDRSYDMLLEPDFFSGRSDQIQASVDNLNRIIRGEPVQGAISGDKLTVNLRAFFNAPPQNLTEMMPTSFAKHEDIAPLNQIYGQLAIDAKSSQVAMKINNQKVEWRNYLYGRATGWNSPSYSRLFDRPAMDAMRILAETRGSRPIMNSMTMFIR